MPAYPDDPAPPPSRVLLVLGPSSAADAEALRALGAVESVGVVHALADVRRHLQSNETDVVVTDLEGDGWSALDVLAAARAEAVPVPVLVQGVPRPPRDEAMLRAAGASAVLDPAAPDHWSEALPAALEEAQAEVGVPTTVEAVVRIVARANHDAKNPLAIIAGNAQLLLELGRMMELDDDLMHPIRDIEEASQRLARSLDTLNRLRERLNVRRTEPPA